jgi:hypothetical protein
LIARLLILPRFLSRTACCWRPSRPPCSRPFPASAAIRVTQEPAEDQLRIGERVLVDDGSCPAGQIKEVVGASNRQASTGQPIGGIKRIRHCIHR